MPATNAVSERTFSAMRVIINYMRTNDTQNRLNNRILLYVHNDRTGRLDILKVATKCIDNSDCRKKVVRAFSPLDLETKLWQQNLKN